jgi:ribosomal protein S6--L-glutamate ligase
MRLYFILARRVPPVPSPVLVEVFDILGERGFEIESGIPEEMVVRPDRVQVEHDLYLLKSHTELSLSLAGVLAAQGARLLNPYESCLAAQDKIVASRRLRAAGVPAPRTWVTGELERLKPVVAEGALFVKPYRGHRGADVTLVHDAADLAALGRPTVPMLVQEYVEGPGEDLKVYVVGTHVFAVRKPFSPTSFTRPGRPCEVDGQLQEIARSCGRALGLGLYGLDVVEGPEGPVVVDVNTFPGYKGVPDVAPLIADYIEGFALGRYALAPAPLEGAEEARALSHAAAP